MPCQPSLGLLGKPRNGVATIKGDGDGAAQLGPLWRFLVVVLGRFERRAQ